MCILSLNEKQYLQQMEQYKDHAQNAQNISTVCLQNTNKVISTICLLQNTNKLEVVKIICTWKRNQVHTMFTNHFRFQIVTLQTELYDWWELDDHRFQSKLVIIPFFQVLPSDGRNDGDNILQNIPDTFESLTHPQLTFLGLIRYLGGTENQQGVY